MQNWRMRLQLSRSDPSNALLPLGSQGAHFSGVGILIVIGIAKHSTSQHSAMRAILASFCAAIAMGPSQGIYDGRARPSQE